MPRPEYSNGVLIGNWVEDRVECPKSHDSFHSRDQESQNDWKRESRLVDFRQNKLNSLQGIGVSKVIQHDSHIKCGNYTSMNDLIYNHLPKPLCGPDQRYYKKSEHQWYPQPDLLKCYGNNLTTWGLRTHKQYEWACTDVSDYFASTYEDDYVPPIQSYYVKETDRKARTSTFTKTFRFLMTKPLTKTKTIKNHPSAKRKS